jgi:predicted transposase YbfD/YdcC
VPADPSSSIPPGLTVLGHADPLRSAETPHLLAYLATITDPRARAGRRHPLVAILVLAAAAVLAGARSIAVIAEWAADAPQPVRAVLGSTPRSWPPWSARGFQTATTPASGDGRWRSTARRRDGRQVHLLAAMDHATRAVLAQRQVDGAPGEVPAFQPLLADLDLTGVVVTADALQTHADAAEFLVACKQAHYLFTVKANQPTVLARCARLPWHATFPCWTAPKTAPTAASSCAPSRPSPHHFGFPHAAQVIQVTRKARDLQTRRWRTMTVYAVTSLTHAQVRPARLADLLRVHWEVENCLHHVRDVTSASAAIRHHARDPARPLTTLGITLG